MHKTVTFGVRLAILHEKWSKPYVRYGAVNIAEKKADIAQKALQSSSFAVWQEGLVR